MWHVFKYTNICIMGVPEREERKSSRRNDAWKLPSVNDTSCVVHNTYSPTWQSEFTAMAAATITISSSPFLLQESSSVSVWAVSTITYTCLSHSRLHDFSLHISCSWITLLVSLLSVQTHHFSQAPKLMYFYLITYIAYMFFLQLLYHFI